MTKQSNIQVIVGFVSLGVNLINYQNLSVQVIDKIDQTKLFMCYNENKYLSNIVNMFS